MTLGIFCATAFRSRCASRAPANSGSFSNERLATTVCFGRALDDLSSILWDVISLRCIGNGPEVLRFSLEVNGRRPIRTKEEVENEITILLERESVTVAEDLRRNWIDSVGADSLPSLETLLRLGPVQSWSVPEFEQFVVDQTNAQF